MIKKSTTRPLLIYGTRHGTLYNLTQTNLPKTIPAVQLCYGDFHDHIQTLESLPEHLPLKKFLNYPENVITYLTPYDMSKSDCMVGCHYNNKVKVKCSKGYTEITAALYDKMVDVVKPDIYVGLTEYPSLLKDHTANAGGEVKKGGRDMSSNKGKNNKMDEQKQKQQKQKAEEPEKKDQNKQQGQQSNKSNKRAICKTKSYLQLSKFTKIQQNDTHQGPIRLAAVHGGTNISLISRSLEQVLDHAIDGIVLCSMCEGQKIEQREQVYNTITKRLQQEYNRQNSYFYKKNKKLRMFLSGPGKLQDIEHALNFGFDSFEINYPFLLAEKHIALVFDPETKKYIQKVPKRTTQLKPLQNGCSCYSCEHHNESYIAHLVECYEMTAKVLLAIHNVNVYEKWLQKFQ